MSDEFISFDLDGTLVKNYLVEKFWFEEVPREYSENNGLNFEEAKKFVLEKYDEIGPRDIRWYKPDYWFERFDLDLEPCEIVEDLADEVEFYDDVFESLNQLSEHNLIVLTNAPRVFTEVKIERVDSYFSHVFSAPSDFDMIKFDEGVYLRVCEELDIDPSELIHVGDDELQDFEIPRKIGIDSFFLDRESRNSYPNTINNLRELVEKVKK